MRIISVANQKGGCGKTTTAINLSAALAAQGRRTLLIDLDPQAHATYGLGLSNKNTGKTAYNILTDIAERRLQLKECIVNISNNFDIIASNILLSTIEQELKDKEDAVSKLHDAIYSETMDYDYVLIDCPPSLGFLTFNALRAANMVLVPIDMSAFSLMGVAKLLGMLELIKVKIGHSPDVNALATIFDRRTKYSQTMLEEIRALFKEHLLSSIIRLNVALKKAASAGMSAVQFDAESNGAADYMSLAAELIKNGSSASITAPAANAIEAPKPQESLRPVKIERTLEVEKAIIALPEETARVTAPVNRAADVIFAIDAPNARDIHIVGDFNQWKMGEHSRLCRINNAKWEKKIDLPPGRYKYKFVIDGEWVLDKNNQEKEPNPFGSFDSIVSL